MKKILSLHLMLQIGTSRTKLSRVPCPISILKKIELFMISVSNFHTTHPFYYKRLCLDFNLQDGVQPFKPFSPKHEFPTVDISSATLPTVMLQGTKIDGKGSVVPFEKECVLSIWREIKIEGVTRVIPVSNCMK